MQKVEPPQGGAEKAPEPAQQVFTQAASATRRSETPPRNPLWKISWQSATLDFDQSGGLSGIFKTVSGDLYRKEERASRFSAASGEAHRESGDLALKGSVLVESIANSSALRCDEVHYASKGKQLITATGDVQLRGDWGTVTGLSKVIATPDLKTFGTPDLFPNP